MTTSSRPVRVLHLRDSPWVDGPGRTILETATQIDRTLVDYHVGVFVDDLGTPHPLVDALRARSLPVHVIPDRPGIASQLVTTVVGLLDQLQIDVLHTSEFRSNILALLCRRRRTVSLVSTAHGWIANDLRGRVYTWADRVLLRSFDCVILVSHAMRSRLPAWWVPNSRVHILHNALVLESYGRDVLAEPRRVPNPQGEVRLLNVGRLSPEKGQGLLLEAVAQLCGEYPGLCLSFAGVGPLEEILRQQAEQLGVSGRVRFLGYVTDMPALYAQIDLVVQSSFTEGLPNVLLEAAYLGAPVLATEVGGTREVIEHGKSGWLVRAGSVGSLVAGLRTYLARPAFFVSMAQSGRRRIESDFSFAVRTDRQTELYRELSCRAL